MLDPASSSTAPPSEKLLIAALQSTLSLLKEIRLRYQINVEPDQPDLLPHIGCPQDIYNLLAPEMSGLPQEQMRVLLLNARNRVIDQRVIYQGTINSSLIRPAEVFRPAIIEAAANIIIAHNHPSGDPTPSPEDVSVTRDIAAAGRLLDIELLDHLVIAGARFASLKEKELM